MKEGKLDRSRRIAEGAAFMAQAKAAEAKKSEEKATGFVTSIEKAEATLKSEKTSLDSAIAAALGQFDSKVQDVRASFEKSLEEKRVAFDGSIAGLQSLIDQAKGTIEEVKQAASQALAASMKAEGSFGRLKEIGVKPVEPVPEVATPEQVAEMLKPKPLAEGGKTPFVTEQVAVATAGNTDPILEK